MSGFVHAAALVAASLGLAAESKKVDLRTAEGVKAVGGAWKYHDVKLVEVVAKGPDGKPIKTYNIEPKASGPGFDDGGWETIDPTTLRRPRAGGQVCFAWYRIKVALPDGVEGKSVRFVTTVDDYGEVWVDGELPRAKAAGAVVEGFNLPNRVELKDPKPGKVYQIAIFGINGPISAEPANYIFLGDTFLEIADKPAK